MDLIYMDSALHDIGILQEYDLDLAYGASENNMECAVLSENHVCLPGYYLYIEGSEYGGIIDSLRVDTGAGTVTYAGRTWHGMIGSKVILPLTVSDQSGSGVTVKTSDASGSLIDRYLIISGDANRCIAWMLARLGLGALFRAPSAASGVSITNYQFDRYTDAYSGLCKMLASAGLRLSISFSAGHVVVAASARRSGGADEEWNSDQIDFVYRKQYKPCNHMICLGRGELEDRTVVHLYADESGNISRTQTITGLDEVTEVLDYPSAESEEELIKSGTERLQELLDSTDISVDCNETEDLYNVGDMVSAYDEATGIAITAELTKKIVTISSGRTIIQYKVGE